MGENDKSVLDFFISHIIHFFAIGAVIGLVYFENTSTAETSIIEAILTPIVFGIAVPFIFSILSILLNVLDQYFETEKKQMWAAGVVLIITIIICVLHVIRIKG